MLIFKGRLDVQPIAVVYLPQEVPIGISFKRWPELSRELYSIGSWAFHLFQSIVFPYFNASPLLGERYLGALEGLYIQV